MCRWSMPVPGVVTFLFAAPAAMGTVASMPAVTKQVHGHHCSRDHEENPILREPLHLSIPWMKESGGSSGARRRDAESPRWGSLAVAAISIS